MTANIKILLVKVQIPLAERAIRLQASAAWFGTTWLGQGSSCCPPGFPDPRLDLPLHTHYQMGAWRAVCLSRGQKFDQQRERLRKILIAPVLCAMLSGAHPL